MPRDTKNRTRRNERKDATPHHPGYRARKNRRTNEKTQPEPSILVYKFDPNATIPTRGSDGAAGFDLKASRGVDIEPGSQLRVSTGLGFSIPQGYCGQITKGRVLTVKKYKPENDIIDGDRVEELHVLIHNTGSQPLQIEMGETIAQIIIHRVLTLPMVEVCDDEQPDPIKEDQDARPRRGRSKQVRPVGCSVTITYGPITKEAAKDWRWTMKGEARSLAPRMLKRV